MPIKVSIVMPVYNGEKYLHQAIDSIIAQTESNWELIAIDDGSTDQSDQILDTYVAKDDRIRIFHQVNHGVAYSRQFGIDHARGKYCIHVDADDWVEPDYLSTLLQKAEEIDADMVWCDCFCNESNIWRMQCEENPDAMINAILGQSYWGTLWNRLIRTSLCQRTDVKFPDSSMWEDMAFVIQILLHCKQISYVSVPLYHYRQVENSLTHQQSQKDISAEYRKAIDGIEYNLSQSGRLNEFIHEIRGLQLFAIRDFVDDLRFRDYNKFMTTYPEAIEHIWECKDYPNRLKICSWLLKNKLNCLVPVVLKVDGALRKIGFSKQV